MYDVWRGISVYWINVWWWIERCTSKWKKVVWRIGWCISHIPGQNTTRSVIYQQQQKQEQHKQQQHQYQHQHQNAQQYNVSAWIPIPSGWIHDFTQCALSLCAYHTPKTHWNHHSNNRTIYVSSSILESKFLPLSLSSLLLLVYHSSLFEICACRSLSLKLCTNFWFVSFDDWTRDLQVNSLIRCNGTVCLYSSLTPRQT